MASSESELRLELQNLKAGIRTIVHDIGNPLGVIRMTAFYLQKEVHEREKQEQYLTMITVNIEKIAAGLTRLRDLGDDTPRDIIPPAHGPGADGPA